jgi:dihydrofolate reductase
VSRLRLRLSIGATLMGRNMFGGHPGPWVAADGGDVALAGGASIASQYLIAGLVDEMELSMVPILLGGGERLFAGVDDLRGLELVRTVATPKVVHLKFARP